MPSPKDPTEVVKPGPGRLPAGSVPVSALITPPGGGGGGGAALTAHITDPVGAHAATAISTVAGPNWLDGDTNVSIEVQARLDEIISDLTANAGANRTGQPGYSGTRWNIAAGSLSTAMQKLYDASNTRPTWILDANPANNGDYVGANALINAIAALTAGDRPTLSLRPGTYNWDDNTAIGNVNIVGQPGTVIIQNAAGDLRLSGVVTLEDVTLDLSGDLRVGTFLGFNRLTRVTLDVAGSVETTGVFGGYNLFEHILTLAPAFFDVQSTGNYFQNLLNCQMNFSSSGTNNVVDGLFIQDSGLKFDQPAIDNTQSDNTYSNIRLTGDVYPGISTILMIINGSGNKLSQVVFDSVPAAAGGNTALWIKGSNHTVDGVHLLNMNDYLFELVQVGGGSGTGDNCHLSNITFTNTDNLTAQRFLSFVNADNSTLTNVTIDGVTTPASNCAGVYISGTGNTVSGIRLTGTLTGFNGPLAYLSGSSLTFSGLSAADVEQPGANFRLLRVFSDNSTISNIQLTSCDEFGIASELIQVSGADNTTIEHVLLENLGSTTPLAAPVFEPNGGSTGLSIRQVKINNVTMGAAHLFDIPDATNLQYAMFSNIVAITTDGQSMFNIGGAGAGPARITIQDGVFVATGTTTEPAIRIHQCGTAVVLKRVNAGTITAGVRAISVQESFHVDAEDCAFSSSGGAVGNAGLTGASFVRCKFEGGDAGSVEQLFRGSGAGISQPYGPLPLVLTNCEMVVGLGNIDDTNITDPVIFIGGEDSAVDTSHGTAQIKGLSIRENGNLTNWHRSPILAIDARLGLTEQSYEDITLNLNNKSWPVSGAGGGIFPDDTGFLGTDSAAIAIYAPFVNFTYHAPCQNIAILQANNSGIDDARSMVWANGARIDGLTVDGPTAGAGAGGFQQPVVNAAFSEIRDLSLYPSAPLLLDPAITTIGHVFGAVTTFRGGVVRDATNGWSVLRGFFDALYDDFLVTVPSGAVHVAVVDFIGSSRLVNSDIQNDSALVPFGVSLSGTGRNQMINCSVVSDNTGTTFWSVIIPGVANVGDNLVSGNTIQNTTTGWAGVVIDDSRRNLIIDNFIHMANNDDPLVGHVAVLGGTQNMVSGNNITNQRFGSAVSFARIAFVTGSDTAYRSRANDNTLACNNLSFAGSEIVLQRQSTATGNVLLNFSADAFPAGIGQVYVFDVEGSAATIAFSGGIGTITGMTGISFDDVGMKVQIANAANSSNDGVFHILEVIDPTSVAIFNGTGISEGPSTFDWVTRRDTGNVSS